MSSFDNNGPRALPNVIPHDENDQYVAVQFGYDPKTKKYEPVKFDQGRQVSALGPREPVYHMMHDRITEATTAIPETPLGIFNFNGFSYMEVNIKLEGTNAHVHLVPLYWNSLTGIYHVGQSQKFFGNERAYVDVNGCSDVYLLPVEVSGTVTVVVTGA